MAFRGWSTDALDFYEDLAADNSKTFWTAHRAVFDEQVYAPMAALVADLEPEFGPGKIFRPYRDVRFSPDKSPYKTHIACTFEHGGYVQLSADGLAAGRGMYVMTPDQVVRYRRAVDVASTGEELQQIIAALIRAKIDIEGREALKRTPRDFPADHPRAELLRYKGLVAWRNWAVASWLGTAAAKTRVVDFLRTAQPLDDWLRHHVGTSTSER